MSTVNEDTNRAQSQTTLLRSIEQARKSDAYQNYLQVRNAILKMLDADLTHDDVPSRYWQEEISSFDYMFDASPLIVQKLRHHCYHLTGLRDLDYRKFQAGKKDQVAHKLGLLQAEDTESLLVPESPQLGGFGYSIDNALYNIDTLKFYECLIALSRAGVLEEIRSGTSRKVVLEIGAGWGGFAYAFKSLCPHTTYLIVDLPETLLFSATYLKTLFPTAEIAILDSGFANVVSADLLSCDFVFIPHSCWKSFEVKNLDLCINMVSFQEMTSSQVDNYVGKVAALNCPYLYSLNRERSPYNNQLTTVSSIIKGNYVTTEVHILDMQYGEFPPAQSPTPSPRPSPMGLIKEASARIKGKHPVKSVPRERSLYEYRHIIGSLKRKTN